MIEVTESTPFAALRRMMVEEIAQYADLASEAIGKPAIDPRVMAAMDKVPRDEFVPAQLRGVAYADSPLPIGHGKTVSQPFIAALMTDLLAVGPSDVVLEVAPGSAIRRRF
jgi:protein-L-isoaspartate(D-aspartate) O-methyltransferase